MRLDVSAVFYMEEKKITLAICFYSKHDQLSDPENKSLMRYWLDWHVPLYLLTYIFEFSNIFLGFMSEFVSQNNREIFEFQPPSTTRFSQTLLCVAPQRNLFQKKSINSQQSTRKGDHFRGLPESLDHLTFGMIQVVQSFSKQINSVYQMDS